jgi:hypothetical protein
MSKTSWWHFAALVEPYPSLENWGPWKERYASVDSTWREKAHFGGSWAKYCKLAAMTLYIGTSSHQQLGSQEHQGQERHNGYMHWCLVCFNEMRQRSVNGLKCSTQGRNWKWCKMTLQWKKFVVITSLDFFEALRLRKSTMRWYCWVYTSLACIFFSFIISYLWSSL